MATNPNIVNSAIGAAGGVLGSTISAISNSAENRKAFERQQILNKQKYEDMIHYARQFGATPTSLIQGITGSAGGSVPSASTAGNPVPDLGSSFSQGISAGSTIGQAQAAQGTAQAALTNAETERLLGLMRLRFEPAKYFADIQNALSSAYEKSALSKTHSALRDLYYEQAEDIRLVRPWKLMGLYQGLLNSLATFDNIVQDTRTKKAQEHDYETHAGLNVANTEKTYSEKLNIDLDGFRKQFDTMLLSYGIDPNKGFWENIGRQMWTNPNLFRDGVKTFADSIGILDEKMQESLGTHYKRNALAGYGLYKLQQMHLRNKESRSRMFSNYMRGLGSIIPFAGGAGSAPAVPATAGVDWWLKD